MAILDFQKEMTDGTKWRLTLAPQRGVGSVIDGYSIVHEASVSVPLTDLQTRFIAGQIPDWSGYEYLQPTLNKLITHNLLFDFTLPTGYIGAGLDLTSGKWVDEDDARADEPERQLLGGKRLGARRPRRLCARRVPGLRHGRRLWPGAQLRELDANGDVATLQPRPVRGRRLLHPRRLDPAGPAELRLPEGGRDHARSANGDFQTASWYGLSTLAAYKFTPRFEGVGALRLHQQLAATAAACSATAPTPATASAPMATWAAMPACVCVDGCDKGANRYALSVGLNYVFNQYTMFKAEYRYDWSNLQRLPVRQRRQLPQEQQRARRLGGGVLLIARRRLPA